MKSCVNPSHMIIRRARLGRHILAGMIDLTERERLALAYVIDPALLALVGGLFFCLRPQVLPRARVGRLRQALEYCVNAGFWGDPEPGAAPSSALGSFLCAKVRGLGLAGHFASRGGLPAYSPGIPPGGKRRRGFF
jgi:hypothetical protein